MNQDEAVNRRLENIFRHQILGHYGKEIYLILNKHPINISVEDGRVGMVLLDLNDPHQKEIYEKAKEYDSEPPLQSS